MARSGLHWTVIGMSLGSVGGVLQYGVCYCMDVLHHDVCYITGCVCVCVRACVRACVCVTILYGVCMLHHGMCYSMLQCGVCYRIAYITVCGVFQYGVCVVCVKHGVCYSMVCELQYCVYVTVWHVLRYGV